MQPPEHGDTVGLCGHCRHCQQISTARGSTFHLCLLAQVDPRFTRYPPLPVRWCPGHQEIETT